MNSPIITSEVSIPVENAVKSSVELYKSLSSHPQLREHFSEAFFMFLIDLNKHVLVGDWGYTNEEHIPLYAKISVAHRRILDYFCENNGIGSEFWTIIDEAASYLLRRYISPLLDEYKTFFAETYTRLSAINAKRDGSSYGIPRELMRIINSRLDYGETDIFSSPFSGGIGSLIETPENLSGEVGVRNVEDEILTLLAAEVFELSLNVNRYESIEFALYELNRPEACKANKIFLFPPLGLKVETDNGKTFSEVLALEAAFQKLEQGEDTKIAIVTSSGILFRGDKRSIDIRQKLVTSGFIESVTQLPPNLLESTAIPLVQIVLSQLGANRTDDSLPAIRFIDASSFTEKGKLDVESVFKVFNEPPIKGISTDYNFSKDEVDFDLSVIRKTAYIEPLRIEKGYTERTLEDVSQLIKSTTTKLDIGKWVNSSNFPKDGRETSFADLEVIEMTQPRRCEVNKDALLINVITSGDSIKVASFKYAGESIYVGRSILVLGVKDGIALPEWLAWELRSERLQTQMMSFSSGTSISRLQWTALKKIALSIPSIEMQQVEISKKEKEFDKGRAKESGLEKYISELKAELKESLKLKRHSMSQLIGRLESSLDILRMKIVKHIDEQQPLDADNAHAKVIDCYETTLRLGDMVDELLEEKVVKQREIINLSAELNNFYETIKSSGISSDLAVSIGFLNIDDDFEVPNFKGMEVSIAREDLRTIFDNVLENANIHGFKNFEGEKKLYLSSHVFSDQNEITLMLVNNGKPLPKGMDSDNYLLSGGKAGETANSGIGGFHIKTIMDHIGGAVELHNFTDTEKGIAIEDRLADGSNSCRDMLLDTFYNNRDEEGFTVGVELVFPIVEK